MHTNGNFGLGWVISVYNNCTETTNGTYEIRWKDLFGNTVRLEGGTFNMSSHMRMKIKGIDWIHFPYPILYINFTVEAVDAVVTKDGLAIGPFVIFPQ